VLTSGSGVPDSEFREWHGELQLESQHLMLVWRPEEAQHQYEFESVLKRDLNVPACAGFQWFSAETKKDA
jgi:hypothetical protein